MAFLISVIIPAYNVERFIEKAIESVLLQPEVSEIVVVNDGSIDATLEILQELQVINDKLQVYHHEGKINKGRSASRNLGIEKATGNYIAFLDADDYFVDNRFANDKKVFQENEKYDGVYNAVGFHFYREVTTIEKEKLQLNTVYQKIRPEDLFDALISSKYGYLHLDGLTVKKSVFDMIGSFNESLVVAEDSDIIFKMALKCCLVSGIIDAPLAKRGIHDANIFTREDLYEKYNIMLYESIISWSCKNKIALDHIDITLKWLWFFKYQDQNSLWGYTIYWCQLFCHNRQLLFTYLSIKFVPIVRLRKKLFPFLYKN
jgi:glycosyltransferase involved in cell wall biosynthesis